MKHPILLLLVLAGCPGDNTGNDGNAKVLWLALDGSELNVKLVEEEPDPY